MSISQYPLGMSVMPEGWPLMSDAFLGLACWLITQQGALDSFQSDTGTNLLSVLPKSAIDAMVLEATGYSGSAFSQWLDWVAINHWGVA